MTRETAGALITFEGCEGCGKSTQAKILATAMKRAGIGVTEVRDPGSTTLGRHLREYLKGESKLSKEAELLLFSAARAQMVTELVLPALELGLNVVSDRYADSTDAYQGGGRGIEPGILRTCREFATLGVEPRLTVLLDAPVEETRKRIAGPQLVLMGEDLNRRTDRAGESRFENERHAFHRRARNRYLESAKSEPGRWLVLDALRPEAELALKIWERVEEILGECRK